MSLKDQFGFLDGQQDISTLIFFFINKVLHLILLVSDQNIAWKQENGRHNIGSCYSKGKISTFIMKFIHPTLTGVFFFVA